MFYILKHFCIDVFAALYFFQDDWKTADRCKNTFFLGDIYEFTVFDILKYFCAIFQSKTIRILLVMPYKFLILRNVECETVDTFPYTHIYTSLRTNTIANSQTYLFHPKILKIT